MSKPSCETKFSGASGDREIFIFPDHEEVGNRLIYTLLYKGWDDYK